MDVFTTESTDAINMLKQDHEKVKRLFNGDRATSAMTPSSWS